MAFDIYKRVQKGDAYQYVRPYSTTSSGPLDGQNSMEISEERITVFSDASVSHELIDGVLSATITDPTASFNVVNPVTGDVTGTMTFLQLKIYMYSMYLYFAAQRDANQS